MTTKLEPSAPETCIETGKISSSEKARLRNERKTAKRRALYKESPELRRAASVRQLELNKERKAELAALNHTKYKDSRAKWRAENRTKILQRNKEIYQQYRQTCLDHFGCKCSCCGEARPDFLTIDHIGGGGNIHRKEGKCSNMYRWLVKNEFPPGFRLLCWNCNCTRAHLGYCPHELEYKMKVNVTIPDETYEQYVTKYGIPGAFSRMRDAMELCKNIDKDDRIVLLSGDVRRAIEAVFQTTVDSPEKLVKLIQNMTTVKLGDVNMEFSSDQLERLKAQAGFHGRTLETYIREQVDEIKAAMLEKV